MNTNNQLIEDAIHEELLRTYGPEEGEQHWKQRCEDNAKLLAERKKNKNRQKAWRDDNLEHAKAQNREAAKRHRAKKKAELIELRRRVALRLPGPVPTI